MRFTPDHRSDFAFQNGHLFHAVQSLYFKNSMLQYQPPSHLFILRENTRKIMDLHLFRQLLTFRSGMDYDSSVLYILGRGGVIYVALRAPRP